MEMGYIGVDFVVDAKIGAVVLEANARPGLAIQVAHRIGLLPRLASSSIRCRAKHSGRPPLGNPPAPSQRVRAAPAPKRTIARPILAGRNGHHPYRVLLSQ